MQLDFQYENQMAELLLNQLKSTRTTNGLEEGVKQCIAAASHEHDSKIQKILLKVRTKLLLNRSTSLNIFH